MEALTIDAPAHVPPELVVPFDQLNGPEVMQFPPTAILEIAAERPVFYSSFYGGFWVFSRYEDIRSIYQSPQLFKQWSQGVPANPFTKLYKPLYLNPPDHMPWRKVLTPIFAPRQLARLENFIRGIARRELARIGPKGQCEFVSEFADILPGTMFCHQLGLPNEEYPRFSRMAHELIFGPAEALKTGGVEAARAVRARANKEIDDLIAALIPDRRKNPGDDIISILLAGEVNGAPLPEEEIVNMTTLLFFAGTDSTRAAITYAFIYLAQNPAQRDRLVREPGLVTNAAQELIRFHGFHMSSRQATQDVEIGGVLIKEGDLVLMSTGAANRDPAKFPHPDQVDFDRAQAHSNLTFGAGIHRCIGSHLATLQLRVALDEVHRVIKDYRLDTEAEPVRYLGGQGKTIPANLNLVYTPVDFMPQD
ncbi:MAG: cytochrome [Bradyrhizobium sp.]|nr:cytochrome [Bradyrhizobium sp.]